MMIGADDSQLVLVDYQSRLMPAIWQGREVVDRALLLARLARLMKVPVWGTEQNPAKLGPNAPELRALCQTTFPKMHFNACESELPQALRPVTRPGGNARSLPKHLQKNDRPTPARNTIVLAGCEAHVCLLQTALGLLEQEFDVWVVTDACSSRRERDRDAAFDRLAGNGVELVTSEMVAFEWLQHCEHPAFHAALKWIK
ncbi:isochorismatase family protein [Tepidicella baoligensis]|uniref:isochorismatase family protein n=1 Tax=Tepidicella baoligensis TaxID=2707016 RepID=UPI0015DAE108|nr:isochorismatase family protein [Tepidicella baoligensis]